MKTLLKKLISAKRQSTTAGKLQHQIYCRANEADKEAKYLKVKPISIQMGYLSTKIRYSKAELPSRKIKW